MPNAWDIRIPIDGHGPQHIGILANFVSAILDGAPLIAPAREGIFSLELANAFLQSSWEDRSVRLPLDASHFEQHLKQRIASSSRRAPKLVREASDDMAGSFR